MGVVRYSTGYRNLCIAGGSIKSAVNNGVIYGYSGTQPSSADDAPSGTNLIIFSNGSGAFTAEVQSTGSVTLTGGASGTVDSITVNSVELLKASPFAATTTVAFSVSLSDTATAVAAQINKGTHWHGYRAAAASAVITLSKIPGYGATPNTHVVAFTGTTVTGTTTNMTGGVSPVNGIVYGAPSSGAIAKDCTISGVGLADGNITWVRVIGPSSAATGSSTTAVRIDMDAATAGAFFAMSSTAVATGATITIDAGTFTEQATVTG